MTVRLAACLLGAVLLAGAADAGKPRRGPKKPRAVLATKLFRLTLPPGWSVRHKVKPARGERWILESPNGSSRARITAITKPRAFGQEVDRQMARVVRRAKDFRLLEQKDLTDGGERRFYALGTRAWETKRSPRGQALVGAVLLDLPRHKAVLRIQMSVAFAKLEEAQARFARFLGNLELVK